MECVAKRYHTLRAQHPNRLYWKMKLSKLPLFCVNNNRGTRKSLPNRWVADKNEANECEVSKCFSELTGKVPMKSTRLQFHKQTTLHDLFTSGEFFYSISFPAVWSTEEFFQLYSSPLFLPPLSSSYVLTSFFHFPSSSITSLCTLSLSLPLLSHSLSPASLSSSSVSSSLFPSFSSTSCFHYMFAKKLYTFSLCWASQ